MHAEAAIRAAIECMQVAFSIGAHRPEGTLVEGASSSGADASGNVTLHSLAGADLLRIQRDLANGHADAAYRRAKLLHEAPTEHLDNAQRVQLVFELGVSCAALHRPAAARKHFSDCEAMLSPLDPALLPCLLNRGLVLLSSGNFVEATTELRRARHLCDGLFGSKRTGEIRSRVLTALGAALLGSGDRGGAEAVYRDALDAGEKAEDRQWASSSRSDARGSGAAAGEAGASGCLYFGQSDATSSAGQERRERGARVLRAPQDCRAALAALLQSRGEHAEAAKLLHTQLKALRAAQARGKPCAEERAYIAGRLAISAFATRRDATAMAALREATELRMLAVGEKSAGSADGVHAWVASIDEPLPLARAALRAVRSAPRGPGA